MSTLRVLTVSVKAGACSGGSSWSAAFYLQILAQNGSCEMPACISNAQARTKCLVLSFIVLHVRSIRCIRRGDHCSVVFCFVHLVLSSMYLVYSHPDVLCLASVCRISAVARDVVQGHAKHSRHPRSCTVVFRPSCLFLLYLALRGSS